MDEDAVHDVRVNMKRLRGLVRLYRRPKQGDPVQNEVSAHINSVLRDVANVFSTRRDVHVLAETLDQVARKSDKAVAVQLRAIRREILAQTVAAMPDMAPERLIEQLQWVREAWHGRLSRNDPGMEDALLRMYRKNQREGWQALNARDPHQLHEWRKRVKYFYYQLSAWPGASDWRSLQLEMLRKLGSLLGKVHDLDILQDYLQTRQRDYPNVLRQVRKRRVRLMKKIRRLYARTLAQPKKDFFRKMQDA